MFKPGLRHRRFSGFLALVLCAYIATACSPPSPATNKAQILDDVNQYLDTGDCSDALSEITPLYDSTNTDNDVRMAMASVYACFAGFNFFNFISQASSLNITSGGVLFQLMAKEFPSAVGDKIVESAGDGIDALMATLNPGEVLIANDLINTATDNEGSLLYTDRTQDSNDYLFFLAMNAMGGEENRQGADSSGNPTNTTTPLSWTTSTSAGMSTDGCAYASALVNFADSISSIPNSTYPGTQPASSDVLAWVAYALNGLTYVGNGGASFAQTIYQACIDGCQNVVPTSGTTFLNLSGKWVATCGSNTGCSSCSLLLRDRNNCAGTSNDEVSCAAAGVINFVNSSAMAW